METRSKAQLSEKLPVKKNVNLCLLDSVESIVFVFVLKLKVNTYLQQLLTCKYSKIQLLKGIQCCC